MEFESAPDPAIEKIRSILHGVVGEALKTRPEGAHLTFVGGLFGKDQGAPFEQFVNFIVLQDKVNIPPTKRKMLPFIQQYCQDLFELSRLPDGAVIIKERSQAVPDTTLGRPTEDEPRRLNFQKSIWVAFVRPLLPDRRRFLNVGERPGYTDLELDKSPLPDWKEVDRKFIAGVTYGSPIDGHAVRDAIVGWARENDVDLSRLTISELGDSKPRLADLARIIDALPSELASRWLIPAEVLRHLRK